MSIVIQESAYLPRSCLAQPLEIIMKIIIKQCTKQNRKTNIKISPPEKKRKNCQKKTTTKNEISVDDIKDNNVKTTTTMTIFATRENRKNSALEILIYVKKVKKVHGQIICHYFF